MPGEGLTANIAAKADANAPALSRSAVAAASAATSATAATAAALSFEL